MMEESDGEGSSSKKPAQQANGLDISPKVFKNLQAILSKEQKEGNLNSGNIDLEKLGRIVVDFLNESKTGESEDQSVSNSTTNTDSPSAFGGVNTNRNSGGTGKGRAGKAGGNSNNNDNNPTSSHGGNDGGGGGKPPEIRKFKRNFTPRTQQMVRKASDPSLLRQNGSDLAFFKRGPANLCSDKSDKKIIRHMKQRAEHRKKKRDDLRASVLEPIIFNSEEEKAVAAELEVELRMTLARPDSSPMATYALAITSLSNYYRHKVFPNNIENTVREFVKKYWAEKNLSTEKPNDVDQAMKLHGKERKLSVLLTLFSLSETSNIPLNTNAIEWLEDQMGWILITGENEENREFLEEKIVNEFMDTIPKHIARILLDLGRRLPVELKEYEDDPERIEDVTFKSPMKNHVSSNVFNDALPEIKRPRKNSLNSSTTSAEDNGKKPISATAAGSLTASSSSTALDDRRKTPPLSPPSFSSQSAIKQHHNNYQKQSESQPQHADDGNSHLSAKERHYQPTRLNVHSASSDDDERIPNSPLHQQMPPSELRKRQSEMAKKQLLRVIEESPQHRVSPRDHASTKAIEARKRSLTAELMAEGKNLQNKKSRIEAKRAAYVASVPSVVAHHRSLSRSNSNASLNSSTVGGARSVSPTPPPPPPSFSAQHINPSPALPSGKSGGGSRRSSNHGSSKSRRPKDLFIGTTSSSSSSSRNKRHHSHSQSSSSNSHNHHHRHRNHQNKNNDPPSASTSPTSSPPPRTASQHGRKSQEGLPPTTPRKGSKQQGQELDRSPSGMMTSKRGGSGSSATVGGDASMVSPPPISSSFPPARSSRSSMSPPPPPQSPTSTTSSSGQEESSQPSSYVIEPHVAANYKRQVDDLRMKKQRRQLDEVFYGRAYDRQNIFAVPEKKSNSSVSTRSSTSATLKTNAPKNRAGRKMDPPLVSYASHYLLNVGNPTPTAPIIPKYLVQKLGIRSPTKLKKMKLRLSSKSKRKTRIVSRTNSNGSNSNSPPPPSCPPSQSQQSNLSSSSHCQQSNQQSAVNSPKRELGNQPQNEGNIDDDDEEEEDDYNDDEVDAGGSSQQKHGQRQLQQNHQNLFQSLQKTLKNHSSSLNVSSSCGGDSPAAEASSASSMTSPTSSCILTIDMDKKLLKGSLVEGLMLSPRSNGICKTAKQQQKSSSSTHNHHHNNNYNNNNSNSNRNNHGRMMERGLRSARNSPARHSIEDSIQDLGLTRQRSQSVTEVSHSPSSSSAHTAVGGDMGQTGGGCGTRRSPRGLTPRRSVIGVPDEEIAKHGVHHRNRDWSSGTGGMMNNSKTTTTGIGGGGGITTDGQSSEGGKNGLRWELVPLLDPNILKNATTTTTTTNGHHHHHQDVEEHHGNGDVGRHTTTNEDDNNSSSTSSSAAGAAGAMVVVNGGGVMNHHLSAALSVPIH